MVRVVKKVVAAKRVVTAVAKEKAKAMAKRKAMVATAAMEKVVAKAKGVPNKERPVDNLNYLCKFLVFYNTCSFLNFFFSCRQMESIVRVSAFCKVYYK